MEHDQILQIIKEAIYKFGFQEFQSKAGISVQEFLKLIKIYLTTSVIEDSDDKKLYIQKLGVCIGALLASKMASMYLGKMNREVQEDLRIEIEEEMIEIMEFVDDHLVLYHESLDFRKIKKSFEKHQMTLEFTEEWPNEKGELQFLDTLLIETKNGICVRNQQRMAKAALPFRSSHARSIKVGIVKGMLRDSVTKSCLHEIEASLEIKFERLREAEYPEDFVRQQAVSTAIKLSNSKKDYEQELPVAVIQQSHEVGNWLRNLGKSFGVEVVFKYENKLATLPPKIGRKKITCGKRGHREEVVCESGVIYSIPMKCGKEYIGQSGRCINTRIYEHNKNLKEKDKTISSSMVKHTLECNKCEPVFNQTKIVGKGATELVREIIEAVRIREAKEKVISNPSIKLSKLEQDFLSNYE
jgi:hypothetical protein